MQASAQGFRLSPQQKHLWSLQQGVEGQSFRAVSEIWIEGNLRSDILRQALESLIRRHEILRTTFHRPPGIRTPFQVVSEETNYSWHFDDLSSLNAELQQRSLADGFSDGRQQICDFGEGPLLRVSLCKLSDNRHSLLVSLPAICGDSLTLTNFAKELSRAYECHLTNQQLTPELSERMQYADFAEWQNEVLEADDEPARLGKAFWEKQRSASVALPTLPLEKQVTKPQVFEPELTPLEIDALTLETIEAIAREHETSISSFLFACWQAVVARLTRQNDFWILTLCGGRKFEDLQPALGLYAKYLPIHCKRDDGPFVSTLRRVSDSLNEANECEEYFDPSAFATLSRDSVAFDFEQRLSASSGGGLSFSVAKHYTCINPFKLKLSCALSDNSLFSELQHDPQVFDRETAGRLTGYFRQFVRSVVETKGSATGAVEILSEHERHRVLIEFNETGAEYAADRCIHELFEAQVEKTPAAIAVVCADQQLSYLALKERANQVAHLLRERGVGPNVRVGICMHRSVEVIIGLLGILKAGGAYVPLNPEHPSARLTIQLRESDARACLTNDESISKSLQFDGDIIDLKKESTLLQGEPATNPEVITNPENLVYVIYTSGSTGVPKGVAVRHRNLVNYSTFILQLLRPDTPLNFATVSTINADLGNTCIFPSLISGGCLHILDYDVAMEGTLFSDYLTRHTIDVLKIVPSHLRALFASNAEAGGRNVLPSKYLILGGETLTPGLVEQISATNHTCNIINHYGPTETTVGSLTFRVQKQHISPAVQTIPIGRPIANTRAYILDERMGPVPIGVAAELYIGGAGVAEGYLNRPEETALQFVPDSFSGNPDALLYRTGDLARYLPDGNFEFLGRVDHQVKIRGYRVELGEIEAVISQHPQIRQAVAIIRRDAPHDEKLITYIVPSGHKPPAQEELRNFLKEKLPDYMIPSAFVYLRSLPLTANGKVDRALLPSPDESRPEKHKTFVAPRNAVETEVASIWASVLKFDQVGVHDNFFDLGGHSLLATQVISRMRKAFQQEIALRSLFESPTVAELARRIESANEAQTTKLLAELEALSDEEAQRLLELEESGLSEPNS